MRTLFLLLFLSFKLSSQQIYWVSFTTKDTSHSILQPAQFLSTKAIERRAKFNIPIVENDLPINHHFIQQLINGGCIVLSKSKWFNTVTVIVPHKKYIESLAKYDFVRKAIFIGDYKLSKITPTKPVNINELLAELAQKFTNEGSIPKDTSFYGKAYRQLQLHNLPALHQQGFLGQHIDIALIDAGFNNVSKLAVFKHLFDSNRIYTTYDFVQHHTDVFEDDDHGTAVLSCVAGYLPYQYVGAAPSARFMLLRSEDAYTEMPIEEAYWIAAIEFADSAGADLVNSSLGYNEFDNSLFNHSYRDLNGSTFISTAANLAVQKGMVVVVSAGNEGDKDWKFISVPADAKDVIAVGGVDANNSYAAFSSIGPTDDKRVKPDVMAQGDNVWVSSARGTIYQGDGTSYSSPILAGAVACLMQAHPTNSPKELSIAIKLSASKYNRPDSYLGYGIPDIALASSILENAQKNKLVDIRLLADKKLHVTCCVKDLKRITCIVMDEMGINIFEETIPIRVDGAQRFQLKKIVKLKKGSYTLLVKEQSFASQQLQFFIQ